MGDPPSLTRRARREIRALPPEAAIQGSRREAVSFPRGSANPANPSPPPQAARQDSCRWAPFPTRAIHLRRYAVLDAVRAPPPTVAEQDSRREAVSFRAGV